VRLCDRREYKFGDRDPYLLNAGDSNDLAINVPDSVQQIFPDALEEVRIVTGAAKAEYGRNAGATVELVSKSGGNSLHGGLQETFRNKVLNADDRMRRYLRAYMDEVTPTVPVPLGMDMPEYIDWCLRGSRLTP
jgi:hypothetical protein